MVVLFCTGFKGPEGITEAIKEIRNREGRDRKGICKASLEKGRTEL